MPSATEALAGVGVLVTRPAQQADNLCRLIEQAQGTAYRLPALEIRGPEDPQPLQSIGQQLNSYDYAIFISANAVQQTLDVLLQQQPWPAHVRIAVIGQRSAQELQRYALSADLCPESRFDSDGLLALPALQAVNGRRFIIFRGNGGREYLGETLKQRGAEVDYIAAYRRICPNSDPSAVITRWQAGAIDVVVINSAESLRNLWELLGEAGQALLRQTPLLLVSERMLPLLASLGLTTTPILAKNATDDAVMQALSSWRTSLSPAHER